MQKRNSVAWASVVWNFCFVPVPYPLKNEHITKACSHATQHIAGSLGNAENGLVGRVANICKHKSTKELAVIGFIHEQFI